MNYKNIEILNSLLSKTKDDTLKSILPVSVDNLMGNEELCEYIIDYLGDLYVVIGFDAKYCENEKGKMISHLIDFVAEFNI